MTIYRCRDCNSKSSEIERESAEQRRLTAKCSVCMDETEYIHHRDSTDDQDTDDTLIQDLKLLYRQLFGG